MVGGVLEDLFAWGQHAGVGRNVNLAGFSGCPSGPGFSKFPRACDVSRNRSLNWRNRIAFSAFFAHRGR